MLDTVIKFSLRNRVLVLFLSVVMVIYGSIVIEKLPIDVFPDLNKPTVTIMTEAFGFAPEEVETLVTTPLENAFNGVSGITKIRSSSGVGLSIIYLEFDWGSDTFRNRQMVAEKLVEIKERLPAGIQPQLAPITSLMGEIQLIGLEVTDELLTNPMELRTYADWFVKPRLQSVPGVSQVITIGGGIKQIQIKVSANKLNFYQLNIDEVLHHMSELSQNSTGGYLENRGQEYLIRNLGRASSIDEIKDTVIGTHLGKAVLIKDVARVEIDSASTRGDAGISGKPGVILSVSKQPGASTLELTQKINQILSEIEPKLPKGIKLHKNLFKQSDFINNSILNIEEGLRDSIIFVAIILFLFLMNIRTTIISLSAIPFSFILTFICLKSFNLSINTMTLGGLAIALGELVDDAIVDVENVLRRLKENQQKETKLSTLKVIFLASSEIRNSIVFSTLVVVIVFIPLFYLEGLSGKLFAPLGLTYIISLIASLLVSLTITPVLCYYLLPKKIHLQKDESSIVIKLKKIDHKMLDFSLEHPKIFLAFVGILFVMALGLIPNMGKDFLPKFNEGSAVITLGAAPGTSLSESNKIGMLAEKLLMSIPEVQSISRRTGRAEQDEHAEGVHSSELDITFTKNGRERSIILDDVRNKLKALDGISINIGQPISHRLDHMLSGVKAEIVIKLFGPDLNQLRKKAYEVKRKLDLITGLTDVQVEQQTLIPQIKIQIIRDKVAKYGIPAGKITELLQKSLNGEVVSQIIEDQKYFNVFMRFDNESRKNLDTISNMFIKVLPDGRRIKLQEIADVFETTGPNIIQKENTLRRIVIMANAKSRNLDSLNREIELALKDIPLKEGYFFQIDGQSALQKKGHSLLFILGIISIISVLMILYYHFRSLFLSLQVMINIPLALIGSVFAIYISDNTISLASIVAFITLCGIASRNGIMMITHYLHLMKYENEEFSKEMVIRGSLERLVPVLMTAFSALLALMPILLSKGEPGKEILHPLSIVIVGGLLSSTLLDMLVTPTIFYNYSKNAALISLKRVDSNEDID